ncbi:MAG: type II and III secretion system protein [Verrucomicrobiales bacterium]|nr:type II and III secretion system protein [Verrucomicrobiales bacterium]
MLLLALACGSGDKQPNGRRALSRVLVTPLSQEESHLPAQSSTISATNANAVLAFEVFSATVPESELNRLGLHALFESPPQTLPSVKVALETSSVLRLARSSSNATLEVPPSCTHVGRALGHQLSNLVAALKGCSNATLTGPMKLMIRSGQEGEVSSGAAKVVVMDVNVGSGAATFVTTNLNFGVTAKIAPLGPPEHNRIALETIVRTEEFRGYQDPGKRVVTNAAGLTAVVPLPIFRVGTLAGRAHVAKNEALVLGGPIRTNVQHKIQSVPFLRDLPTFGRFFRRMRSQTNCERSLIIVRPAW